MALDQLSYWKLVLEKISTADPRVFRKELRKAFNRLVPADRSELAQWFRTRCVCRVDQVRTSRVPVSRDHDLS